ncbi:DEAD (Asp-Glu-Ala-Asp) box polypeptide 20 [Mortierella claussenii]|nr:DEAD (Asp-Glu-Ala-Asp) box polypeptide 20 [Mortierella claussenii]
MTLDQFRTKDVLISEDLDFSSLVQHPALLKGLAEAGYQKPSPIQLKTIPLGRLGLDLIAQAKSGTGKTIVFSVIAIEAILSGLSADTPKEGTTLQHPRAVIIAPTREIAVQIQDVILSLIQAGLGGIVTCHSMIGGMPIQRDKENLKRCSIVVGTPGRVRSLISTGHLNTSQIRLLVLDEADKLMEDVFKEDVFDIAKGLGANKQVMAFSATYDDDLLKQLDHLVKNPVYVMLSNGAPELEGVLQYFKVVALDDKHIDGSVFLKQTQLMEAKFAELESLLTHVPFYQGIVFLNHRSRAADLVKFLTRKGWPAMHIASGISQEGRLEVMKKARMFELRILVCSDLIARGIDIDRVNLVVNLDLPKDPETYLHRIGRTGRYGTTGLAVSIVDDQELKTIEILKKDFGITIQQLSTGTGNEYIELNQSTKVRHHVRPLQSAEDLQQFIKLEAERVLGEKRALNATEEVSQPTFALGANDGIKVRQEGRRMVQKGPGKRHVETTREALKKRKIKNDVRSQRSLLTPEMALSFMDSESETIQDLEVAEVERDVTASPNDPCPQDVHDVENQSEETDDVAWDNLGAAATCIGILSTRPTALPSNIMAR